MQDNCGYSSCKNEETCNTAIQTKLSKLKLEVVENKETFETSITLRQDRRAADGKHIWSHLWTRKEQRLCQELDNICIYNFVNTSSNSKPIIIEATAAQDRGRNMRSRVETNYRWQSEQKRCGAYRENSRRYCNECYWRYSELAVVLRVSMLNYTRTYNSTTNIWSFLPEAAIRDKTLLDEHCKFPVATLAIQSDVMAKGMATLQY
jgi:hypothetical protein